MPGLMRDAEEAWKQAGRLRLGERTRPHSQLGELLARPDTTIMIARKRRLTAAMAAGKRCFGAVPRGLHAHGMQNGPALLTGWACPGGGAGAWAEQRVDKE